MEVVEKVVARIDYVMYFRVAPALGQDFLADMTMPLSGQADVGVHNWNCVTVKRWASPGWFQIGRRRRRLLSRARNV
jgi:hypothetical protein